MSVTLKRRPVNQIRRVAIMQQHLNIFGVEQAIIGVGCSYTQHLHVINTCHTLIKVNLETQKSVSAHLHTCLTVVTMI